MEIRQIFSDKKRYLELLLLADEEERMIDRYLERGALYVLGEPARALCVVTDEGGGVAELKTSRLRRSGSGGAWPPDGGVCLRAVQRRV